MAINRCVYCAYYTDCNDSSKRTHRNVADCGDYIPAKGKFNWMFDLWVGEQVVDTTNLSEYNPELAMELFLTEFEWDKKIPMHQKDSAFVLCSSYEAEADND